MPTLKGRSTRPRPNKVLDSYMDIPEEFLERMSKDLELAIDIVFINSQIFLTTIDRTVLFKAVVPLKNREDKEILCGLNIIINYYEDAGFDIIRLHADGEFESLKEAMRDMFHVKVNLCNPDEHVEDVKRFNRSIKEKFRVAFYYLPFKAITQIMVDNLAMECGYSSNLVPAKGGVSKYFSRHVMLKCQVLDI